MSRRGNSILSVTRPKKHFLFSPFYILYPFFQQVPGLLPPKYFQSLTLCSASTTTTWAEPLSLSGSAASSVVSSVPPCPFTQFSKAPGLPVYRVKAKSKQWPMTSASASSPTLSAASLCCSHSASSLFPNAPLLPQDLCMVLPSAWNLFPQTFFGSLPHSLQVFALIPPNHETHSDHPI